MRRYGAVCGVVLGLVAATVVSANIISLNFSENSSNQGFVGGELIGPLKTDSAFWNNSNGLDPLASNSMTDLIDDSGANTGVSVAWTSPNCWWNKDGTGDDEHRMAVGYLDDSVAPTITFSGIPYAEYRVYGLVTSDSSGSSLTFAHDDFQVNGVWAYGGSAATSATSHGSIDDNLGVHGEYWTQTIPGSVVGNYFTLDTTGSTLSILGRGSVDGRNPITAVIIEQIPEPASVLLLGLGGLLLWRRWR